jgi:8-oxo-dGTP pyrophosphatase MutT (NUDIX family)
MLFALLPRLVAAAATFGVVMSGSVVSCLVAGPRPAARSASARVDPFRASTTRLRRQLLLSPLATAAAGDRRQDSKGARITMQNSLFRIRDVNKKPPRGLKLLDFVVDGTALGKVSPTNADLLIRCGDGVFCASNTGGGVEPSLTLSSDVGPTFEDRTKAVAAVADRLRQRGHLPGWRDELYPVSRSFHDPPAFAMERAAVPWIGALEYGVHVNGLVAGHEGGSKGGPRMWMARRSPQKAKFPGMLDHIVAGGQPLGMSLLDNVVKECHEEAGIPEEVARHGIRPASAISYETFVESSQTLSRAVLFNYDLHLPQTFVPVPVDGEVDEFFLWTMDEVLESLDPNYPDPIKPNCYSGA